MPDARGSKGPGFPSANLSEKSSSTVAPTARGQRDPGEVAITARYSSILDFHQNQSLNINRWGMFLPRSEIIPVGTLLQFAFILDDGLPLLSGKGKVVWQVTTPHRGIGVRFSEMDEDSRRCLEGIVATNERESRKPSIKLDFSVSPVPTHENPLPSDPKPQPLQGATRVQPGLFVSGRDLRILLSPATVGYFTNNPLINIRLGGFVVPCEEEASLGSIFAIVIESRAGHEIFSGSGKVVAKHEHRLGIRFVDPEKGALARLQADIATMAPMIR